MVGQKLRIQVIREDCIGDGACADVAPELFEVDGEGVARCKAEFMDNSETVLKIARACPTDAIIVTDVETGEQLVP